LHGVGLSVVNALSEWAKIDVFHEGKHFIQEYKTGIPKYATKEVGSSEGEQGTWITFKPDATIFPNHEFKFKTILQKIRQYAYLNGGLTFNLEDHREENPIYYSFHFEGGIRSYVKHINSGLKTIQQDIFFISKELDDVNVEVAMQY